MRQLFAICVAVGLVLSVSTSALAAPVRNPHVGLWELVCPEPVGMVVVVAKGVPGWPIEFEHGTAPIHLRAAEWWAWEDGQAVDGPYVLTPPPGLESKLFGPCLLHVYGGSTETFDLRSETTWFQFP